MMTTTPEDQASPASAAGAAATISFGADDAERVRFRRGLVVLAVSLALGLIVDVLGAREILEGTAWFGMSFLAHIAMFVACTWLAAAPSLGATPAGMLMRRRLRIAGFVYVVAFLASFVAGPVGAFGDDIAPAVVVWQMACSVVTVAFWTVLASALALLLADPRARFLPHAVLALTGGPLVFSTVFLAQTVALTQWIATAREAARAEYDTVPLPVMLGWAAAVAVREIFLRAPALLCLAAAVRAHRRTRT